PGSGDIPARVAGFEPLSSKTEPDRPNTRGHVRRSQTTDPGRGRSPVEEAARGLPSAAFTAEPDYAATDDLIRVATSDFVPKPKRRMSFAQGTLLCLGALFLLCV